MRIASRKPLRITLAAVGLFVAANVSAQSTIIIPDPVTVTIAERDKRIPLELKAREYRAAFDRHGNEHQTLLDVHATRIDLVVSNVELLAGEKEKITISWDRHNIKIDSYLNNYIISQSDRGLVEMVGNGRRAVRPVTDDFTVSLTNPMNRIFFSLRDSRTEELSRLSPDYHLLISFRVREKGGMCGMGKTLLTTSIQTDPGVGNVEIELAAFGATFQRKGTVIVDEITVERRGTPYFSGGSGKMETLPLSY